MTTASADPALLHELAAALTRASRHLDDASVGPSPGRATLQARLVADRLAELGRDVRRVAAAFEAADRGPGPGRQGHVVRTDDHTLVERLVRRYPGMASGALTASRDPMGGWHGFVALVAHLGATRFGRDVLRSLADDLVPGATPTPVVVALARALLLGPTERDDALDRPIGPAAMAALRDADAGAGSLPVLALLAADADATRAFEASRPGRSPVVDLHRRVPAAAAIEPITRILAHLVLGREPVARVVDGLAGTAIDTDSMRRVPPGYSRFLARAIERHPSIVEQLRVRSSARHRSDGGAEVGPLTTGERFYEALARDRVALRAAVRTLAVQRRGRLATALRNSPPGTITGWELQGVLTQSAGSLADLATGADAAGRYDRDEVRLGIHATSGALQLGLAVATRRLPPPNPGARVIRSMADTADQRLANHDDQREQVVAPEVARSEAHLVARAMSDDPRWAPLLVGRPPAGAAALRAWVARQPPQVRSVFTPLSYVPTR